MTQDPQELVGAFNNLTGALGIQRSHEMMIGKVYGTSRDLKGGTDTEFYSSVWWVP